MPISFATYERVVLEDDDARWELDCGRLRRKPAMTARHNEIAWRFVAELTLQLDRGRYSVRMNAGHLWVSEQVSYVPDVIVVPRELVLQQEAADPSGIETYRAPLPLVIEVWSPSTGDYDVETKLPNYQRRGDTEIWRAHPRERTLTAWRRQPDGSYTKTQFTGDAVVAPVALPGVRIALGAVFE